MTFEERWRRCNGRRDMRCGRRPCSNAYDSGISSYTDSVEADERQSDARTVWSVAGQSGPRRGTRVCSDLQTLCAPSPRTSTESIEQGSFNSIPLRHSVTSHPDAHCTSSCHTYRCSHDRPSLSTIWQRAATLTPFYGSTIFFPPALSAVPLFPLMTRDCGCPAIKALPVPAS